MTNVGLWDAWNSGTVPAPYANTRTYREAERWLRECDLVEDWGCGRRWFSTIRKGRYLGVDGSGEYADVITDLAHYRSRPDGILLRHVIEHDYRWREILDNAVASFKYRMMLVIFTPLAEETHEIAFTEELGVPDISFAAADLADRFGGATYTMVTVQTKSQYGCETLFALEKP
jgi:hypothetical protein